MTRRKKDAGRREAQPFESPLPVKPNDPPSPPKPGRPRKGSNALSRLVVQVAGRHRTRVANKASDSHSGKYKLAYDAAVHALSQQDGTLTNLRNRAMGLVTIATLIGSFSSFFGLGAKDHPLPLGYALGLIVFILFIAACSVFVLWPKKGWTFGPDPADILVSEEDDDRTMWSQALGMQGDIEKNEKEIKKRARLYSIAVIALGLEAAFAVATSLASR